MRCLLVSNPALDGGHAVVPSLRIRLEGSCLRARAAAHLYISAVVRQMRMGGAAGPFGGLSDTSLSDHNPPQLEPQLRRWKIVNHMIHTLPSSEKTPVAVVSGYYGPVSYQCSRYTAVAELDGGFHPPENASRSLNGAVATYCPATRSE